MTELNITVFVVQLCDPEDRIWRMDLQSHHEGLQQPWNQWSVPSKGWRPSGSEDLGQAEDGRAGWQNGCCRDRLLLGNRSARRNWNPEIWPHHQRVSCTETLMANMLSLSSSRQICFPVFFFIAALTLLIRRWRWRTMDGEHPTPSLSTHSNSLARMVKSSCIAK